jgi:hypothetical protein
MSCSTTALVSFCRPRPASFREWLPTPVVVFPFDVNRRETRIDQKFRITQCRTYIFGVQFDYLGPDDLRRVLHLVGQGEGWSGGSPGVVVPVRLKITRLSESEASASIIDDTIYAQKWYSHGFDIAPGHGWYRRKITAMPLGAGDYEIDASTIKNTFEFNYTRSYLVIDYRPNIRYSSDLCNQ